MFFQSAYFSVNSSTMPYCRQPFVNLRIHPSQTGIELLPCCHYQSKQSISSLPEYYASIEIKNLRETLLTDSELPDGCAICRDQEAREQPSWRQRYNSAAEVQYDQKISELEVFMNNTCNLKCIMCDPRYSSALGAEQEKLGWIKQAKTFDFGEEIEQILSEIKDVKSISFIGGEFFLSKNSLSILDLAEKNNISIKVITNATILTDGHLQKLSNLPSVDIQISLDGINENYEFMRYPAKWDVVKNNILKIKKLEKQKVHVNTVVQVLNFSHIPSLLDWCNRQLLPVQLTDLGSPHWLSWKILRESEKEDLISSVRSHIDALRITSAQKKSMTDFYHTISIIDYDFESRDMFLDKMSQIMNHRQISKKQIFQQLDCLPSLADELWSIARYPIV